VTTYALDPQAGSLLTVWAAGAPLGATVLSARPEDCVLVEGDGGCGYPSAGVFAGGKAQVFNTVEGGTGAYADPVPDPIAAGHRGGLVLSGPSCRRGRGR